MHAIRLLRYLFWALILAATIRPAGAEWRPVGLSGGGAMFSPGISPADKDLMLVNCDMGAAYISEDGGHNWRMVNQSQLRSDTACRPAFHPVDARIIYASSGGRLRVSRDRGRTFAPIGNLRESLQGEIVLSADEPDVMLAGTRAGHVQRSRDGGKTWAQCAGPTGQLLAFHFDRTSKGRVMFAGTKSGIWRSDDGGTTWSAKTNGLPWSDLQGFAGGSDAVAKTVILYCSVRSRDDSGTYEGGIYRSRDRGEHWEPAMGHGINTETKAADQYAYAPVAQYHQLLVADARPATVYAVNTATGFHPPHHETVYRSDDAGETWRATYYQDPRFKECNVEPDYEVASTGQSFKGGNPPFGIAICKSDPQRLLYVMNVCHVTHDGGRTWFNGSTHPATTDKPRPGTAWVCNGQVVTTTWHYYVDPFENNRHYITYTDIGFARSLDGGNTWIWWDPKTWAPWRNTCYEIAFDPEIPGRMWAAFSNVHDIPNDNIISERHGHQHPGGICVSRDFGASWKSEAQGLPRRAVTSVVVDPRSARGARTLYTGVFDEGVFKSVDDGRNWTVKKNGLGDPKNMRVYRVVLHQDGTLFAIISAKRSGRGQALMGEGVGLYRSTDGAETWQKITAGQPFLYPKDFSVHPRDSRRILIGVCDAGGGDSSGGLYSTIDGGQGWKRIGRQGPQTFGGYYDPQRDGSIYMTLTEGAPGAGLWLTRDDGASWQPFPDLPFSNIQRVEIDPRIRDEINVTTFGGSVWRGPSVP